jgi:transposase
LGEEAVAAHQKKARRLNAHIVFLDETGFLMAPLVRRTWRPRGATPTLYQRTRSHKKVSVIGALSIAPSRDDVRLYFRSHADQNVNAKRVRDFLRQLLRELDGQIVLIWDRFQAHRARAVTRLIIECRRIHVEFLPPYAPELNPIEYVWGYWKNNPLANYAPNDLDALVVQARSGGRSIQRRRGLLKSLVRHAPFYLPLIGH